MKSLALLFLILLSTHSYGELAELSEPGKKAFTHFLSPEVISGENLDLTTLFGAEVGGKDISINLRKYEIMSIDSDSSTYRFEFEVVKSTDTSIFIKLADPKDDTTLAAKWIDKELEKNIFTLEFTTEEKNKRIMMGGVLGNRAGIRLKGFIIDFSPRCLLGISVSPY